MVESTRGVLCRQRSLRRIGAMDNGRKLVTEVSSSAHCGGAVADGDHVTQLRRTQGIMRSYRTLLEEWSSIVSVLVVLTWFQKQLRQLTILTLLSTLMLGSRAGIPTSHVCIARRRGSKSYVSHVMTRKQKRSVQLQQNANEESEIVYDHNKAGMPPSSFTDVDDPQLRTYNRGAVLANIFERYVDARSRQLLPKDLTMCVREIKSYLESLPKHERDDANASMHVHLEARGYRENITA